MVGYYNKPLESEVKYQQWHWLPNVLSKESLNLISFDKLIVYPADSTLLLKALFQPHFLVKFKNLTEVLRAALLINLCIDLCGRIS